MFWWKQTQTKCPSIPIPVPMICTPLPIIIEMKQCVDWSKTTHCLYANEKVVTFLEVDLLPLWNNCSSIVKSDHFPILVRQESGQANEMIFRLQDQKFSSAVLQLKSCLQHLESAPVSRPARLFSATIDHEDEQVGSPHNLLVMFSFFKTSNCSENIFPIEELYYEYE